jgi:hypothetical protein
MVRLLFVARFTVRYTSALLTVLIAFLLALPAANSAAALQQQDDSDSLPGKLTPHMHSAIPKDAPDNEPLTRMQKEMEKKANQERQLHLKTDTDKLFKLVTELKVQVDKSNENILSLDVVKKADEIEKLAHSVKEKMRGEN